MSRAGPLSAAPLTDSAQGRVAIFTLINPLFICCMQLLNACCEHSAGSLPGPGWGCGTRLRPSTCLWDGHRGCSPGLRHRQGALCTERAVKDSQVTAPCPATGGLYREAPSEEERRQAVWP